MAMTVFIVRVSVTCHPMRFRTLAAGGVVVVTALALSAPFIRSYTRSAALIVRMAGLQGPVANVLEWEREPVTAYDARVPSRHGALRARLYLPDRIDRAIVLVAGVNALGIDEPRLYGLAHGLANVGYAVLTPELPDLQRYDITPRTTDMIEDAAAWLAGQPRLARDGRVGLVGISFAGGLSIVAAGRPALRDRVAFVFSFGGHSDFQRVLRFLCSGKEPSPPEPGESSPASERYRRPHDYGVVIVLLGAADRLVPPEQVTPLRHAILTFLLASHYDLIDQRKAAETFAEARRLAGALEEPARTLMRRVNERDVEHLGATLLPLISQAPQSPALSPDRSPAPPCPVYILHGTDDNVVPAVESQWLARSLEGRTRTRLLLSRVITHAELNSRQDWREIWQLVDFFASLLRE
jgi:dienelactone hydrolase